ncbi:MAG: tRNA guanosine(34) transglycosylase Tgt [Deltaproteobacteria bacterium]|nr:tRNA guanosine(34) transglycosylase Tgt [Deltaproteobacteria bacterium]
MRDGFAFEELSRDGDARTGRFTTPHAIVQTPAFMPVGTQGSVKAMSPDEIAAMGTRLILANTYHLWLRPGAQTVDALGGLHGFTTWDGAFLTDSGGYQVFSLSSLRKIDDDGVSFRSHLDGSERRLTPEEAMRVQMALGSDIAMVLDECPPGDGERAVVQSAMRRTSAWARRCLAVPQRDDRPQARFGIVQGATDLAFRRAHLDDIASLGCDGVALGGFSVGEPIPVMYELLADLGPRMPRERPRYLMGVGTPIDLLHGIGSGIDLFDCVLPTRNGRNGQALTWHGRVNVKQARHARDDRPLDERCDCPCCTRFSRAYLRHLFVAGEILALRLLTQHNLHLYARLTRAARDAITAGTYASFARDTEARMREGDELGPPDPRK